MEEKKVTIYDIAARTNVSVGTVHRALNNKSRISPKTKKMILETAESMGYKVNVAAQGLRRLPIKIGAILFCPVEEYVDDIIEGISSAGAELEKYNVFVDIKKIPYTESKECLKITCDTIVEFYENNYNGIILFASLMLDEMEELSKVINSLGEKKIAFASVANEIPGINSVVHVGVDAFTAGSMAAEILELSCKGKDVALLVASDTSPINNEYIKGFTEYAKSGVFSNVRIYEHFDDKSQVGSVTEKMLEENPELSGIYMTTASSALACKCIKSKGKKELSIITTDILKETPELLDEKVANAAIFQNPHKQGKDVVKFLYSYITAQKDAGAHFIAPQILLSSNIKLYL